MLPRSIRNNNPLNIRKSPTKWQGEIDGTDPDFCTFINMLYGCRAALVNLRTHIDQDRRKCIRTTVKREIERWAPPSENHTKNYIDFVCQHTYLKEHTVLDFSNKNLICVFLYYMAIYECGDKELLHFYYFERAFDML